MDFGYFYEIFTKKTNYFLRYFAEFFFRTDEKSVSYVDEDATCHCECLPHWDGGMGSAVLARRPASDVATLGHGSLAPRRRRLGRRVGRRHARVHRLRRQLLEPRQLPSGARTTRGGEQARPPAGFLLLLQPGNLV